jgi:putative two-component system response regulator
MKPHILFVDDEATVLAGLRRLLHSEREQWQLSFVESGLQALAMLRQTDVDAVVSDVRMPLMDGLQLLETITTSAQLHDVPVVMLTGDGDVELKRRALELGAADLLTKPVAREDLLARMRSVLRIRALNRELRSYNQRLEREVAARTRELVASRQDIIWRLAKAAEYRDEETGEHVVRVGGYCRVLAERLGLPRAEVETLALTSPLHDLGKIGIPDGILRKPGPLTDEERQVMQGHCVIGCRILKEDPSARRPFLDWVGADGDGDGDGDGDNPLLRTAWTIALTHHEWWNGHGYPHGLAGEAIPVVGRITALADVYDALSSARPYKPAFPEERVLRILRDEAGTHFDPAVHAAFERSLDTLRAVREEVTATAAVEPSEVAIPCDAFCS